MSLTAERLKQLALGYVGVEDESQAPGYLRHRMVHDLNGALQEVYRSMPSFLKQKSLSAWIRGPRQISGKSFVQGSCSMSGGDVITNDMLGCTFSISGEGCSNEIVSENYLQNPYLGVTTGSGRGVVYGDCVVLCGEVEGVLGVVCGSRRLEALDGRSDYLKVNQGEIGEPRFYWVEMYRFELRLRVYPLPEADCLLRYDVELKAPLVSYAELWPDTVWPTWGDEELSWS